MSFDFITIGGATEDITFYTREGVLISNRKDVLKQKLLAFEYGAKIKIDESHSTFGGGASNTAVNLAGLGFKAACLVAVGDDNRGRNVIDNLKQKGVNTSLIQKKKNSETGFSFLLVGPNNEHIVFSNRAANKKLNISTKETKVLQSAKWAYLTSLHGDWLRVLQKVFKIDSLNIAWNPGHVQIVAGFKKLKPFLSQTKVLALNKDEAIELVVSHPDFKNKPNSFLNNTRNLLKALKGMGPEIVLITRGKEGADCYDGEEFYYQSTLKEKKRVDTTGVGDAFNSSFVAGLELFKGDIKKSLRLGARNSASVIGQQGAQNGLLTSKKLKL